MNVAVVGGGATKMGEHWTQSLRDLSTEAGAKALQDAGIEGKDIEALFIGTMSSGRFIGQEHLGALAVDEAGLTPIPATRCEGACASGSLAFRKAYLAIRSGEYDIVMAAGGEKMTDIKGPEAISALMGAGDQEWESSAGLTFSGLYAMMARAYMKRYGLTREELALVPIKNHFHGLKNPLAQFQFPVTVKQVMESALIADPLRLLDCSPITDGAAAVILVSDRVAKRFKNPMWILGSGQASDTLALHNRKSLTEIPSSRIAAEKAYAQAGVSPGKIDVAEVHDCFSIEEILAYEDLGFAERGKGKDLLVNKETYVGGRLPVNTDGGLKLGHPVGATGIKQIIEIMRQLRGDAYTQVKGARIGLAHNIGGSGATALVHIFGTEPGGRHG
ncbi:MAG: thiolase domain-containing protein [Candidatus Aenigmarchaeota archaeon]|nr:thiolase domain-containing protein [Candidatus Aenigmarchaeota archaeon]